MTGDGPRLLYSSATSLFCVPASVSAAGGLLTGATNFLVRTLPASGKPQVKAISDRCAGPSDIVQNKIGCR